MATDNKKTEDFPLDSPACLRPIEGYENVPLLSLELAVEPLMTLVPSIQTYVRLVKEKCQNPTDDLTCDQSASIMLCTMRWQPLNQCLSYLLNITLQSMDRQRLRPWFSYLKLLFTSLCRLPSIRRTVYRGIQTDVSAQYSKGQIIAWWGLPLSTPSIHQLYSKKYLNLEHNRTIFIIECNSSKDISKHSLDPSAELIALLPATQFRVIQSAEQRPNLYCIQLEEVQSPVMLLQSTSMGSEPFQVISSSWNYKLSVSNEDKHPQKLEQLISVHPPNSPIRLRYEKISNSDMKIIVQQAILEKGCTELWLYNTQITAQGALLLSNGLFNNFTLRKLYLNDNSIRDRGVLSLCRVLSVNNITLQELYLARNDISSKGAEYLADMLSTNRTLTTLSLYGNRIDDEGIRHLTGVLTRMNTSLEYLYLSGNTRMTDVSVNYLMDMFQQNQTLRKVHLFNCNLSPTEQRKLREMSQTKTYLLLNL